MIIPSPETGPEVNQLVETFISITGAGPLNKEEIDEIVNWCDKQETKILLNSAMQYYFNDKTGLDQIYSEYSIWFEDAAAAAFFKMKWA